jgi:hypothetical protein
VKIILPTLKRVNTFCQTSSPSLDMLHFLQSVFGDLAQHRSASLGSFLSTFLVTLARCIPHHLNEEIFLLCESLLDLMLLQGSSDRRGVVECMVEALTDKYTMRSKAHKRMCKYFMQRVVVEESLRQIETAE